MYACYVTKYISCFGICSSLVAETSTGCILGGSALGKRNESAEQTGSRAAEDLLVAIKEGACVDKYTQDQLIIFMALANGQSKVRVGEITLHTKTAIHVAERLTTVNEFLFLPSILCENFTPIFSNQSDALIFNRQQQKFPEIFILGYLEVITLEAFL